MASSDKKPKPVDWSSKFNAGNFDAAKSGKPSPADVAAIKGLAEKAKTGQLSKDLLSNTYNKQPYAPKFQSQANAVLNTLNTTAAWSAGFADERIRQSQAGEDISWDATLKALDAANENANAWKKNNKTIDTRDILVNRLNWDPKNPLTTVAGFAGDVLNDPLNFADKPISVTLKLLKGASKGALAAVDAGKLSWREGNISADAIAKQKLATPEYQNLAPEAIADLTTPAGRIKVTKTEPTATVLKTQPIAPAKMNMPGAAAKVANEAAAKIKNLTYQTAKLTPAQMEARTFWNAVSQTAAASLEAGRKNLVASIVSDNANEFLTKYARRDISKRVGLPQRGKLINIQQTVKTRIRQEGDVWKVLSGNGEELATAATKAEAQKIVRDVIKPGVSASTEIKQTIAGLAAKPADPTVLTSADALKITTKSPEGSVLKSILSNVQKAAQEIDNATNAAGAPVKYAGFEDLIVGLSAGDNIDSTALKTIVNALDPEKRALTQAVKKDNAGTADYLRTLISGEGVKVYDDIVAQLKEAENLKEILTLKGVGFGDEIAIYANAAADPAKLSDASQEVVLKVSGAETPLASQTSKAAAVRWAESDPRSQSIANFATRNAFEARNKTIDIAQASSEANRDIATTGELMDFSHNMRLQDGTTAVSAENLNNIFTKDIMTSMVGTRRKEYVARAKKNEEKGILSYNPESPAGNAAEMAAQHDEFATQMVSDAIADSKTVRDLLMSAGKRVQNSKIMDGEKDFAKAYKKYGADYRAADIAHTAYIDVGDIFQVFRDTGAEDLIKRGFFPYAPGKAYQTDSLLWLNLLDAARHTLEQAGKNVVPNAKEITTRLLARFKPTKAVSNSARLAEMKEVAAKMGVHLASPDVIARLKDIHMQRAIGIVNDYAVKTRGVADDLFEATRRIYLARTSENNLSKFQQVKLMRETFRDFYTSSDIFKLDGGPIAESLFRTYGTVLLNGGDLDRKIVDEVVNLELKNFHKEMRKMAQTDKPFEAADVAVRKGAKVTPERKKKVENFLAQEEKIYGLHMMARDNVLSTGDNTILEAWLLRKAELQASLNKARLNASKAGIEPRHYSNGEWIPASIFNYDKALAELTDAVPNPALIDDRPLPLAKIENASPETQAKMTKTQREVQAGREDDIYTEVEKQLDAGMFDDGTKNEADQVVHALQLAQAKSIDEATSLAKVRLTTATYAADAKYMFNPNLTEAEKAAGGFTGARSRAFSDRWQQRGSRQEPAVQFLHANEITAMSVSSRFADYLTTIAKKWSTVSDDVTEQVWSGILAGVRPTTSNAAVGGLYDDLNRIVELIFGSADNNELLTHGIQLKDVVAEMNKMGLSSRFGFGESATIANNDTRAFLKGLPFGAKPEGIAEGTIEYTNWMKKKEAFKESNFSQFEALSAMAHAVQMVKFKKGMIEDFVLNMSWKNYFTTMDEAIAAGFVKPKVLADNKDFSRYIPSPEDGGLFLPQAVDAFGGMLREFNALYDQPIADWVKKMMNVQGFIKAQQTIFVPGFQVTNAIGDNSAAILAGVRNPAHYGTGWRLANAEAVERGAADYTFLGKAYKNPTQVPGSPEALNLEMKYQELYGAVTGKTRQYEGTDFKVAQESATDTYVVKNVRGEVVSRHADKAAANRDARMRGNRTTSIVIYRNGKPTRVNFSDNDMRDLLKRNGIMITNMYANDTQGLADYLETRPGMSKKDSVTRRLGARLGIAYRRAEKVPGDFAAWHGNVPRIAHAMKVLQSRSWGSIDEAMTAAARQVQLYHPTITSLASSERRYGRAVVGYYTWIRMAHLATLDMAVHHTNMFTMPSKIQNSLSQEQGFEPANLGSPYAFGEKLPSYLTKGTTGIGLTVNGERYIIKPAFMQNQVLDTFNFTYDSSKNTEDNTWSAAQQVLGVGARMVNPVLKRGIEIALGYDLDTGRKSQVVDTETAVDSLFQDFSINQLAKSFGYVPTAKRPENTKTPINQTDIDTARFNWFTRLGLTKIDTTAQKLAWRAEYRAAARRAAINNSKENNDRDK